MEGSEGDRRQSLRVPTVSFMGKILEALGRQLGPLK